MIITFENEKELQEFIKENTKFKLINIEVKRLEKISAFNSKYFGNNYIADFELEVSWLRLKEKFILFTVT